jgi:hypothetical protein
VGNKRTRKTSSYLGLFANHEEASITSSTASTTEVSSSSTKISLAGVIAISSGMQQGSGGATLSGLEISLQNQYGQTIKTTTASTSGEWTFTDVETGDYKLKMDVPSGYFLMGYSSNDISITIGSDSNTVVPVVCMFAGSNDFSNTVGSMTGTLSWLDAFANVKVTISDLSGQTIATTKTDESGKFEFVNLLAGTYSIHIDIPSQYSSMVITGDFEMTVLSNQVYTVNFGPIENGNTPLSYTYSAEEIDVAQPSSSATAGGIIGYVWLDLNKNGVKDAQGSGFKDCLVSVKHLNDTLVAETKTDLYGFYSFSFIEYGVYQVIFENPMPDILNYAGDESDPDNQANSAGIVGNVVVQPQQNTTASGALVVKPGFKCDAGTSNDLVLPNGAYDIITKCQEAL